MRKKRRRPVYYSASSMNDGTVMAAYPIRRIPERLLKRSGQRLDEDNVCQEFAGNYVGAFDMHDDSRLRFFDIFANRLNVRRSLRELVLPELQAVSQQIAELQTAVSRIEKRLGS